MNIEQFERLEQELKDAAYRRYNAPITNNDFYYSKGFEHYVDENGETHPKYQIIYSIWDFRKYQQSPEFHKFGIEVHVIPNFNNRGDLILTRENYDIKEIERIAEDFYAFAVTYLRG
jgi:hypothetical protein